jgi:hypothetical protein
MMMVVDVVAKVSLAVQLRGGVWAQQEALGAQGAQEAQQ